MTLHTFLKSGLAPVELRIIFCASASAAYVRLTALGSPEQSDFAGLFADMCGEPYFFMSVDNIWQDVW